MALMANARVDEAIACFDQALALQSDLPMTRFNKSLTLLLSGRLEQGWPLYEFRPDRRNAAPELVQAAAIWPVG